MRRALSYSNVKQPLPVIASVAKLSSPLQKDSGLLRRYAPRNDVAPQCVATLSFVMAGLVPAIHVFVSSEKEGVDARIKSGHDDGETSVSRPHRTTLTATAFRPGDPKFIRPKGRGECRAPNAPAASRAKMEEAHELVTTVAPVHPAFPHANGFNGLWRALPGDRALLPPSFRAIAEASSRNLMPASRHQDHTLSPSADHAVVSRRDSRPPHPGPKFRDDREAPLKRAGTAQ